MIDSVELRVVNTLAGWLAAGTRVGHEQASSRPSARRDELLAQLEAHERSALHERLHAAVGLRLGGEGPEAIALAIAAELQCAFHSRA